MHPAVQAGAVLTVHAYYRHLYGPSREDVQWPDLLLAADANDIRPTVLQLIEHQLHQQSTAGAHTIHILSMKIPHMHTLSQ